MIEWIALGIAVACYLKCYADSWPLKSIRRKYYSYRSKRAHSKHIRANLNYGKVLKKYDLKCDDCGKSLYDVFKRKLQCHKRGCTAIEEKLK